MPPTAATKNSEETEMSTSPRHASRARSRFALDGSKKRLHFDEQWSTSLQDRHHDAAGNTGHAVAQHDRAGIGNGPQSVVVHLEDANLARRAETVLDRSQDTERVVAITVEGQHGVDKVLDGAWTSGIAVLGDVSDHEERHAAFFCEARQTFDASPHLRHAAGRLRQPRIGQRLQRVDDHEGRTPPLGRGLDRLDVGTLESKEVGGHPAEPAGTSAYLCQRFLRRG